MINTNNLKNRKKIFSIKSPYSHEKTINFILYTTQYNIEHLHYVKHKKTCFESSFRVLLIVLIFSTSAFAKPPVYYRFTSNIYEQEEKISALRRLNVNISEEEINNELLNELNIRKELELDQNCLKKIKNDIEELENQFNYVSTFKLKKEILTAFETIASSISGGLSMLVGGFAVATGNPASLAVGFTLAAASNLAIKVGKIFIEETCIDDKTPLAKTSVETIIQDIRELEKEYRNLKNGLRFEPIVELEKRYVVQKRRMNNVELQEEIERGLIQARVADYYFQMNTPAIGYALGLPFRPKPLLDPNDLFNSKKELIKKFYKDDSFSIYTEAAKKEIFNIIMQVAINSITITSTSPLRVVEHWLGTGSTGKSTAAKEIARFLGLSYFEKRITDPGTEVKIENLSGSLRSFQGPAQLGWLVEALLQKTEGCEESYQNSFLILDDFPVNNQNAQNLLLAVTDPELKYFYNKYLQANLDIRRLNLLIISNEDFISLKPSKPEKSEDTKDPTFTALRSRFRTKIFSEFSDEQKGKLVKPYLEEILVNKYKPPFFYRFHYVDPTQFEVKFDPQALNDMELNHCSCKFFRIYTGIDENKRNAVTVRELKNILEDEVNSFLINCMKSVLWEHSLKEEEDAALKGDPEAISSLVKKKMASLDDELQKKDLMRRLCAGHVKSGNIDEAKKCWIESFKLMDWKIWPQVSPHFPKKIELELDQELLKSLLDFLNNQTEVHIFSQAISTHLYQIWIQSIGSRLRYNCLISSAILGNKDAFKEIGILNKNSEGPWDLFDVVEEKIFAKPNLYSKTFKTLGDIYREGEFFDPDHERARSYYNTAQENGDNSFSFDYPLYLFGIRNNGRIFTGKFNDEQTLIDFKDISESRHDFRVSHMAPNSISSTSFNGSLYIAVIKNGEIFLSSSTKKQSWTKSTEIKIDYPAQEGISLASFKGQLYLAYIGIDNKIWVSFSKDSGRSWEAFDNPNTTYAYQTITLTSFNGRLYLAKRRYWSRGIWLASTQDGKTWGKFKNIIGDKNANLAQKKICLTSFNDNLYLGYIGGDYRWYNCSYTPTDIWLTSSIDGKTWLEPWKIKEQETANEFYLASYLNKLECIFLNNNEICIQSSSGDCTNWSKSKNYTYDGSSQFCLTPFLEVTESPYLSPNSATASTKFQ